MKRIILAVAIVSCLAGCLALGGCQASQIKTAYQVEAATQTSVAAAMTLWADYDVTAHPSAAVEAKVRAAYEKYQAAELLAIDATSALSALSDTNTPGVLPGTSAAALADEQAVANAAADLLDLLKQLGVKIK